MSVHIVGMIAPGFIRKRLRTISQQFMVHSGMTFAFPPKFVTLEEIMRAANFKLRRTELEPGSMQRIIKNTNQIAIWYVFRSEWAEMLPNYGQDLHLLEEDKEGLFSVLLSQPTRFKQ